MSETEQFQLLQRIRNEVLDSIDEEVENAIEDAFDEDRPDRDDSQKFDRKIYFGELLRLQRELIKLQDWVVDTRAKVAVLFEGRDAAGKGGIKRITQRLNPRVCRVVA